MNTALRNDVILLKPLHIQEAAAFYDLYVQNGYIEKKPTQPQEYLKVAKTFTQHILSLCQHVFTIRTMLNPQLVIGGCALHHWDAKKQEMEIGGTLLPAYWGKGIMREAFILLEDFVRKEYQIISLVAHTEVSNHKALRLAEKLGFTKTTLSGDTISLKKQIN